MAPLDYPCAFGRERIAQWARHEAQQTHDTGESVTVMLRGGRIGRARWLEKGVAYSPTTRCLSGNT
ncbi:MAG: hypothetical protein ACXWML_06835, partial [Candidatus Binataceae bacterium]